MGLLVVTSIVCVNDILRKKYLKIPKEQPESVTLRRTDNTMANRKKRKKGQIIIYKTLHRELRLSNTK